MAGGSRDAQLAELGAALLSRADELSDTMLALMRRNVSFHRTVTLVSDDQLRATVRTHLDFILGVRRTATQLRHPRGRGDRSQPSGCRCSTAGRDGFLPDLRAVLVGRAASRIGPPAARDRGR